MVTATSDRAALGRLLRRQANRAQVPAEIVAVVDLEVGEDHWTIRLEEGRTIYFAGDTCVFGDMQLIGRIYSPDVAILPIGGHFTMDPREAGIALELLGTTRCIPCHYGTFPLLAGNPEELRQHAPSGVEVIEMQPGETTTV